MKKGTSNTNGLEVFGSNGASTSSTNPPGLKSKKNAKKLTIGTSINGLCKSINFSDHSKRFIVVGMNEECRVFHNLSKLLNYLLIPARLKEETTEVPTFKQPIWIDVQNATTGDLQRMQHVFKFHPLTTEDIQSTDTYEKWDTFSNYMYIAFVGPVEEATLLKTSFRRDSFMYSYYKRQTNESLMHILVFDNYVLTFHEKPIKGLDMILKRIESECEQKDSSQDIVSSTPYHKFDPGRMTFKTPQIFHTTEFSQRQGEYKHHYTLSDTSFQSPSPETSSLDKKRKGYIPSTDWIFYAFLDALVDLYIPIVDSLCTEVDSLDDAVYRVKKQENADLLRRINLATRNVATLKRILAPKYSITTHMMAQDCPFLTENVRVYLRDVLDHLQMCLGKLDVARRNINQTYSNYATKFHLDIAKATKKTQFFTNQITIFATIWAPVSFISGLFGMNVKIPGQSLNNLYSFFAIVSFLIILTLVMLLYFRKELMGRVKEQAKILERASKEEALMDLESYDTL